MKGKKIELTEEQLRWFEWAFPRMKNAEIAAHFGIGYSSVERLRRKLFPSLGKPKEFVEKLNVERGQKLKEQLTGRPAHTNSRRALDEFRWRGGGPYKQSAEQIARRVETCRRLRQRDKARAVFGLEQKTRYHFSTNTRQACAYRYMLRQKGYITERFNNHDVWYDDSTRRSARCEATGATRHHLRFHHISEKR